MAFGRKLGSMVLAVIFLSGPAQAQFAQERITAYLDGNSALVDVEARRQGSLAVDGSETFMVSLWGEDFYWIGAICDAGCSDVSIEVSGEDFYVEVGGQQAVDVTVYIPNEGTYSFTVTIRECSTPVCHWGAMAGVNWMLYG